jgi:solute carrier family 25 carnitine/acylcarnitine transporter 20/29
MQTATVKIQAAAAQIDTFGTLHNIYVKEGVRGLYRGVTAPLLAVVPAFAITFWSYDVAKNSLMRQSGTGELTINQTLMAGAFSGIPLAAVVGPSERIKCMMQVGGYNSFTDCARSIYREGGLRSIFRGCGATMLRDVPGNAAYFGTYEICKRTFAKWEGRETASVSATFMAGGLAGIGNWVVAIPFDVLKSRYQTAPSGMYRNLMHVFRELIHTEGFGALFRGLSPALIRAFPANGACLAGVESARTLFAHFQES